MNNFLYVIESIFKVVFTLSVGAVCLFLLSTLAYFIATNLSVLIAVFSFIIVIILGFELIRWLWSGSLFKKG